MKRSTQQILFRYLPDAVFQHEDGFLAQVHHVNGGRVSGDVNQKDLLDAIADERDRWRPEQAGIPDPRTNPDEFYILKPDEVVWDVFPLTFECVNPTCRRVRRWFAQDQLLKDTAAAGKLRCAHCKSKMRQLRYVTAHNCGAMQPVHTPKCSSCNSVEHMYLDDTGSFRSSSWRCRQCGGSLGMRLTPCSCGAYARNGRVFQRGFTARDGQLWIPQMVTIINISDQSYDHLQAHPQRGAVALASWLGDEESIARSMQQLEQAGGGARKTVDEWATIEATLRASNFDEQTIEHLRSLEGPVDTGVPAIVANVPAHVVEAANHDRLIVERAGLFDRKILTDRQSFADLHAATSGPSRTAADHAAHTLAALGIADISVTQQFPVVVASYGYSRAQRVPGQAHLRGYAKPKRYDGKNPIFAVPARTEALLVTFDALALLGFMAQEGLLAPTPAADDRAAKLALAELLASDPTVGGDGAAGTVRRLVHSASHALLRALDDGQTGFGESSLAEWVAPDTLTSAIYVASYTDFTLGAFETVLRQRVAPWLEATADAVNTCDNDPMCSHRSPERPHAACDRCLHLSFGCRTWNADLDRLLLRRFWLYTQRLAAT
jgi:hypothetical protein